MELSINGRRINKVITLHLEGVDNDRKSYVVFGNDSGEIETLYFNEADLKSLKLSGDTMECWE